LLAARKDYGEAYFRLAECFHFGYGVAKNELESMDWLEKAREIDTKLADQCCKEWFSNISYDLQKIEHLCNT